MSASSNPIENILLERFVDGELDDRQQRELLARLDEEPDGWRRLALSFAESQFLGRELRFSARSSVEPAARQPQVLRPRTISWASSLALAASLMVAVGVGLVAGRAWNVSGPARIATDSRAQRVALPADPPPPALASQPRSETGGQVGLVTWLSDDGTPIQLPVYDAAKADSSPFASRGSAVPREVLRALRSAGHEIKKEQRLWPIELNDGRQIVVPVEQLEIEFVGNKAFQ